MKIRPIEKDVYNAVNQTKFITPDGLRLACGSGHYGLYSLFIPDALICTGMSKKLVEAIHNLRMRGDIYEIACGEHFSNLLESEGENLPVVRFNKADIPPRAVEHIEGEEKWLPVVYCNNEGVIWLLKSLAGVTNPPNSNDMKSYNKVVKFINGSLHEKLNAMVAVSNMLDNVFADLWEEKVTDLEVRFKNVVEKFDDNPTENIRAIKKQLSKKHKTL